MVLAGIGFILTIGVFLLSAGARGPFPLAGRSQEAPHSETGSSRRAALIGIYLALLSILMFFAAFSVAMFARRGTSDDWVRLPLPDILWINTVLLVASSVCLEWARRGLHRGHREVFNFCWTAGLLLGIGFLFGQYTAWSELLKNGFYVNSGPSSSFFYMITVAHALHLSGGLFCLLYVEFAALRFRLGPAKRTFVDVSRNYWRFMGAIWVYVILLFQFWG